MTIGTPIDFQAALPVSQAPRSIANYVATTYSLPSNRTL